jgi:AbiV family abortive infection protein
MAKALDVENVQREAEIGRSDSTVTASATTEKETRPMLNDYSDYPPLDRNALRDGYKLCVMNAQRFISDVKSFMGAGRYRSANLILVIALEEMGSAIQLYEAGCTGVSDWKTWWRRYFSRIKDLESSSLGIARRQETDEDLALTREDLAHVNFDKIHGKFIAPGADEHPEFPLLVEKEAAYAEEVLKALPLHAFERWELEVLVRRSPEIGPAVLYARVEELVKQEPSIGERDLLTAIARDLGRSPDELTAGFERWKEVAPKARVYMDLLQRVQHKIKGQETE